MSIWNDSLLIGVTLIDNQHRELINRMDQLMHACSLGKGGEEIEQTLRFVVSYIKEHFKDEEGLQTKHAYPEYAAHKKLHDGFVLRVIELVQEFQKLGTSTEFTGKVNKTLIEWFVQHIRTEDKKLALHLKRAGGEH